MSRMAATTPTICPPASRCGPHKPRAQPFGPLREPVSANSRHCETPSSKTRRWFARLWRPLRSKRHRAAAGPGSDPPSARSSPPWPGSRRGYACLGRRRPARAGAGDDRLDERVPLAQGSFDGVLSSDCRDDPVLVGRNGSLGLRPFELRPPASVTLCPSARSWHPHSLAIARSIRPPAVVERGARAARMPSRPVHLPTGPPPSPCGVRMSRKDGLDGRVGTRYVVITLGSRTDHVRGGR